MKIQISDQLKLCLASVEANGSIIAGGILPEIRRNADVAETIEEMADYCSTKRKKQTCGSRSKVKVFFRACNKDVAHPDFPDRRNARQRERVDNLP